MIFFQDNCSATLRPRGKQHPKAGSPSWHDHWGPALRTWSVTPLSMRIPALLPPSEAVPESPAQRMAPAGGFPCSQSRCCLSQTLMGAGTVHASSLQMPCLAFPRRMRQSRLCFKQREDVSKGAAGTKRAATNTVMDGQGRQFTVDQSISGTRTSPASPGT